MSKDFEETYDALYSGAYRARFSGFEWARRDALRHFIPRVAGVTQPRTVLDYGAGRGLYLDLWRQMFPGTELSCSEISTVALRHLQAANPDVADRAYPIVGHRAEAPDAHFEVILSIEVMEHVDDLRAYIRDILRLLEPGGTFVWTTPCGNALSIEHLYSWFTGQIDETPEGYRRWRWEEPTHVRRLKTREIRRILEEEGFTDVRFRFRSHLISFLLSAVPALLLKAIRRRSPASNPEPEEDASTIRPSQPPSRQRLLVDRLRGGMISLDYLLFRLLPNGASMLGCARKPPSVS